LARKRRREECRIDDQFSSESSNDNEEEVSVSLVREQRHLAQVNFSDPKISQILVPFKNKHLATHNCVKYWGKVPPHGPVGLG